MNRRAFLAWLGGTAAGVALAPTLDLDKLLWIPGEKKIFIPEVIAPTTTISVGGTLKKGDVFTIDGIFAVDPQTGLKMRVLQEFVISADVSSDGSSASLIVEPVLSQLHPRGTFRRIGKHVSTPL